MAGAAKRTRKRRKRCRFCEAFFSPDPRVGVRQIACSRAACQTARKKVNQEDWLERQPDYFKGRYANTKRWLQGHPGYLAAYRRRNPERVAGDNERRQIRRQRARETAADIQDSISLQASLMKELTPVLTTPSSADIQDSIWAQVVFLVLFSARYLERRYTRLDRPPAALGVPSAATLAGMVPDDP